jgi:ABC-2 type transport system permease protein
MLLRTEAKLLLREPVSVLLGLLAPIVILVGISFLPDAKDASQDLGGLRAIDTFVPTLSVFAVASLGLITLPNQLAGYRSAGVLKRLRTTPASPLGVVLAQLALTTALGLTAIVLVTVVGHLAFDVPLPDPAAGWVLAVVLATTSLLSLGMVIAATASSKAAEAVGPALWFPLMFFGGLWVPRPQMSEGLRQVSDLTPVGAAVGALQDVTTGGAFPDAKLLLVMATWTIVATAISVRTFRWE